MVISCGQALLQMARQTADYAVFLKEGDGIVKVLCHKCVLIAHSVSFQNLINAENFFDIEIILKPGYMGSMIELLQFLYLKNPHELTNKKQVLELAGMLEMKLDFFIIQNVQTDQPHYSYPGYIIQFNHYENRCFVKSNFLNLIDVGVECTHFVEAQTTMQT